MLIYFDRQGAIREIVSSYALSDGTASFKRAEGNSSANRIYCYFEGLAAALPSATAGAISYRLPDGATIGPRVSDALETLSIDFDASRDLRHFAYDKDYAFLRFDVPDEVFSLSGLISATASATIGEATYQFGPITFMVDGEVLAQADIDYSQWQYLISQFARYLPLSGGTMAGGIVSEGTGRKATFGDGILKLEDTVYGRKTEIGKYAIATDGGNFYYPPAAEAGGTLVTDKWSGFSGYLPISGGEITGKITTNNDEIEQKVIIGGGRIGVQDTDDGLVTYFDANYIERVGDKFYYPEWIENGGNLITNRWTGFDKYAKKTDLEDYAKKVDLGNYATKKDFDDLKSIVYGIHSLTYNSYEFDYLTSSIIPDEVDGRKTVGGSYAIMDWVGGNSFSFNQLVSDTQIFLSGNKISVDYNNTTHQYTFKTNSTDWAVSNATSFTWINGHKYLVKINLISKTENAKLRLRYPTIINETSIITPTDNLNLFGIQIQSTDGNEATIIFTINVFDLTRMSLDNATTVEEAKAELLKRGVNVDEYNEFNDGEIRNTVIKGVKVNGYNAFDEELEQGGINGTNGTPFSSSSYFRTVNFAKVNGGSSYTLENNVGTTLQGINGYVFFYDIDKQFISVANIYSSTPYPVSVNIPNNAAYVKACWATPLISNAKICFHLTGSRTGYAPYKEPTAITIPETELLSAGSVHDTIKFVEGNIVEGEQRYDLVKTSNVGTYIFTGNETVSELSLNRYQLSPLSGLAKGYEGDVISQFITNTKYTPASRNQNASVDNSICIGATGLIVIRDTSVADSSVLLSYLTGKTLYYELATPTTTTIATDLTFEEVSAIIEQNGSIEAVYEEVPPTASIDFMTKGE